MGSTKIFEGLGSSTLIPQRGKVGPDQLKQLGTEEGFVLSRVDGNTTLEEICLLVPFETQVTQVILRRLAEVGAIDVPGVARKLSPTAEVTRPHVAPRLIPTDEMPTLSDAIPRLVDDQVKTGRFTEEPARPAPAAVAPAPALQLSETMAKRIDAFYQALDGMNAFQLLEIGRDADLKDVKRAYFRLSKDFHPDRYYGRELGVHRPKLTKIFQAIKQAFEVLSDKDRRAAYEESVGPR